jgi:hypothetical protein
MSTGIYNLRQSADVPGSGACLCEATRRGPAALRAANVAERDEIVAPLIPPDHLLRKKR